MHFAKQQSINWLTSQNDHRKGNSISSLLGAQQ